MSEQHSSDHQQQHHLQHSPGINIQEQYPMEADVTIRPTKGGWSPTKLHRALYDTSGLADRLIESVRSLAQNAGSTAAFYDALNEAGVTALNEGYADLCVGIAKGRTDAAHELIRTTRQLGGQTSHDIRTGLVDIRALTSVRTFRHVLTPERFESGKLGDLLANHADLLRNSRCLGYLKDAAATAEGYTDALLDAADHLRTLTKHLSHGNCENETRFRGEITREALGLAGTLVHLLDLADVEVIREARIPRFSRDFKPSQKVDLAKTLAYGTSIQSHYGEFAVYRQLFEPREKKRESTFSPKVDASDPFGECIGSFVLVGKGVEGFTDQLCHRLSNQEVHDDAPEFTVQVPVEVATDRQHVAHSVRVLCQQKSIHPTREATSMLAALTGTPYDAAEALHNLGSEMKAPSRGLRLNEVRYALSTLDTDRILPAMNKPTLSKVVHALLTADTPLVQSELASRADVSARSIRNHIKRLKAFDFIRGTDEGWRFALPFHTGEERGDNILPWYVATAGNNEQEHNQDTLVRDVVAEAVYDLIDANRYADPDDTVAGVLFAKPGKRIPALQEVWKWLDPWISVVEILISQSVESGPSSRQMTATVGEQPEQASLAAAAAGGGGGDR